MLPTGQVDCAAQGTPCTLRGDSYPCSYLTSDSFGLNPPLGTEGCNSFWWNYQRSEAEAAAGHLAFFRAAAMSGWFSLSHIYSCPFQELLHLDLGHITSLNITYTSAEAQEGRILSKALICAENTCVYEKQWFSPEYSSICYHKEIHQKLLSSLGQSSLL